MSRSLFVRTFPMPSRQDIIELYQQGEKPKSQTGCKSRVPDPAVSGRTSEIMALSKTPPRVGIRPNGNAGLSRFELQ